MSGSQAFTGHVFEIVAGCRAYNHSEIIIVFEKRNIYRSIYGFSTFAHYEGNFTPSAETLGSDPCDKSCDEDRSIASTAVLSSSSSSVQVPELSLRPYKECELRIQQMIRAKAIDSLAALANKFVHCTLMATMFLFYQRLGELRKVAVYLWKCVSKPFCSVQVMNTKNLTSLAA